MGIFWDLGKSLKKSVLRCFIYRNGKNVIAPMWRTIFFQNNNICDHQAQTFFEIFEIFFFWNLQKKAKKSTKMIIFWRYFFFINVLWLFSIIHVRIIFVKYFYDVKVLPKKIFFWYTKGTCRNFWNVPFVCKYLKFCRLKNQY